MQRALVVDAGRESKPSKRVIAFQKRQSKRKERVIFSRNFKTYFLEKKNVNTSRPLNTLKTVVTVMRLGNNRYKRAKSMGGLDEAT